MDEDRGRQVSIGTLVQALRNGTVLDLAPGKDVDVSQAEDWPLGRRIPGEALRAALLDADVQPDPRGLKIRAAYITGLTDLANLRLSFGLDFDLCAFEQFADWSGVTLSSLKLTRCRTPGLALADAHIGGVLDLEGATLTNDGEIALCLNRADVKGSVFLSRLTATGEVRIANANIGGQLHLSEATLKNGAGIALLLYLADVKGSVVLPRLTATGEVRLSGTTIGGELYLSEATLKNDAGIALALDNADIKGGAFLDWVKVTGPVLARAATIGDHLTLDGATLTNEEPLRYQGIALLLQSARIGNVRLMPSAVTGKISLEGAQITVLGTPDDDDKMKVLTSNELFAAGWRLGDVHGLIRHDRTTAADWLSRDAAVRRISRKIRWHREREFVPQPWHELANVYERNGQPADARWMRWKAAWNVTRTSPLWSKFIRWIYGLVTGHGYYPLIAAVWLVVAIVASAIIVATNAAVFTPTADNKAALKTLPRAGQPARPITGAASCEDFQDRSSCLNPVLYALDNALPGTLATGQAAQWTANGAQGTDAWIPYALGGLKLASWIFVALLLAGVTGLLRKT